MLRPRLQRWLDRFNASLVPVVLVPKRRVEGSLSRWEVAVLTAKHNTVSRGCSNSARRIVLSPWRRRSDEIQSWRERHPGSQALPFQHPGGAAAVRDAHRRVA